ncbi:MAG TPA: feruloyl-CoA synthase [Caulobacteraceae bacterium]
MHDGAPGLTAPFRDARYARRALDVERRADGSIVLFNPMPFSDRWLTTWQPLRHWASAAPDRVWLAERSGEGWRTLTYGEAWDQVRALAGALPVARGQVLLILARNGIDHALVAYAAMSKGAAVAPVSPQYGLFSDYTRLEHACAVLAPSAVYVDDRRAFAGALESPFLHDLPVVCELDELLKGPPLEPAAQPDDIAKLLLTSGSTGRPKAVVCLHRNVAINAAQIEGCFDDPDPPITLNSAPWSHSLGGNAILHMIAHRGGALYIDAGQPTAERFGETVRNLREVATTYHNMVPAGWGLLAGELERDPELARTFFSRLRLMQYGGASLAQSVIDRVQAVAEATIGERICLGTGYGATETGPTACNIHWPNTRSGLCGLPTPGTSVKLVPAGEKYEFRVKGPQVSPGYYNAPDLSAQAFDEEGYYRLGDAARLADESDPSLGLVFDGRLVENFKLSSGTFVAAGALRVAAVSAIGGAVADAIVCGEGQEGVGLMLFLNQAYCERLGSPEAVRAQIREGLQRLNASAGGQGGKVARALILDGAPDAACGELTDKGYINQALARERRPTELARLFAAQPDPDILTF